MQKTEQIMQSPSPIDTQHLVSVLIPAYNHEKYVQSTIQSILDQTYENIELIFLNDGSTDDTHNKIEAMLPLCEARFVRTEYVRKENEGIIKTLNRGLNLARGDYVYIIASDDIAEPKAVETLFHFLHENNEYGLAVGDNILIDGEGRQCYWGSRQTLVYDPENAVALTHADHLMRLRRDVDFEGPSFGSYHTLLGGNYIPNGYLIRSSVMQKIGGYSEQAKLEDLHLMLQIAKHAKLKFINKPLFRYRWHDSNMSKQRDRMRKHTQQTLDMEYAYAKEHGLEKYIPSEKLFCIGSFRVAEFKRSLNRSSFRFLTLPIYLAKRKNNKWVYRLLGIRIYKKSVKTPLGE
jgi:alpha-1,3-rhamnosyltransferase